MKLLSARNQLMKPQRKDWSSANDQRRWRNSFRQIHVWIQNVNHWQVMNVSARWLRFKPNVWARSENVPPPPPQHAKIKEKMKSNTSHVAVTFWWATVTTREKLSANAQHLEKDCKSVVEQYASERRYQRLRFHSSTPAYKQIIRQVVPVRWL